MSGHYEVVASRLVGAGRVEEDAQIVDEATLQSSHFRRSMIMFEQMGGTVEVRELPET